MKFSDRNPDDELGINLTPLIDVVFLLLIFFMVSTTFTKESQLSIQLPEASEARTEQQPKMLLIEISGDGAFAIKGPDEPEAKTRVGRAGNGCVASTRLSQDYVFDSESAQSR